MTNKFDIEKFKATMADGTAYIFRHWRRENAMYASYQGDLSVIGISEGDEHYAEMAVLFPYHPITPEEQAIMDAIGKHYTHLSNKKVLLDSLNRVSDTVDNPTHWNRISPETVSYTHLTLPTIYSV